MIELKNIEIGYQYAFLKADLTLKKGELYALIGKNGSGKTTFLQTLAGNLNPISGSINIENRNLSSLPMNEKSKRIALVETRFPQIQFMSGWEYVALGRTPHLGAMGILNENDNHAVEEAFKYLDIFHLKSKFTNEMSDGERQTLLVARALVQETDIILLDEPSAFLDYLNKRKLLEKLNQTSKDLNKCIILSTHDIELCIEFNIPVLIVHHQLKTVTCKKVIKKTEILEHAFGLKV